MGARLGAQEHRLRAGDPGAPPDFRSLVALAASRSPPAVRRSQRQGGRHIAGAVGGAEPRAIDSAARDRHDGNGFAGEGGPVPMEGCQVVPVEGPPLQPTEDQTLFQSCLRTGRSGV